jgi:hypothetical protein
LTDTFPIPQIPSRGQFSPQCLGVLGHVPLWVALLAVTLRYAVGPVWKAHSPIWLRRFAAEKDALPSGATDHESGAGRAAKSWTVWTLSLLLLSLAAAALGAVGAAAWPEHAQLYLTYLFPHVSCLSLFVSLASFADRAGTAPLWSCACH